MDELYNNGINYYYGRNGYPKDVDLALKLLTDAVEQRNMQAMYFLGTMYHFKSKLEPCKANDYYPNVWFYYQTLACLWLNSKNLTISLQQLFGVLVFLGLGYEVSGQEYNSASIFFYDLAAGLGFDLQNRIYLKLAVHYYYHGEFKLSYNYFIKSINVSSENNHVAARYLGCMHENGLYVGRDFSKAIEYYKLADPNSIVKDLNINQHIANLYLKGGFSLDRNVNMAITYLKKAAEVNPESKNLKALIKYYSLPVVKTLYSFPQDIVESLLSKDHPDHFKCSMSLDLMLDPVMLNDGFSYEREQVEILFSASSISNCSCTDRIASSPKNRQEVFESRVCENKNLRQAITEYVESTAKELMAPHNTLKNTFNS